MKDDDVFPADGYTSIAAESAVEYLSKAFTIVPKKDVEFWIIIIDGNLFSSSSNKSYFKRRCDAVSALRNAVEYSLRSDLVDYKWLSRGAAAYVHKFTKKRMNKEELSKLVKSGVRCILENPRVEVKKIMTAEGLV